MLNTVTDMFSPAGLQDTAYFEISWKSFKKYFEQLELIGPRVSWMKFQINNFQAEFSWLLSEVSQIALKWMSVH